MKNGKYQLLKLDSYWFPFVFVSNHEKHHENPKSMLEFFVIKCTSA